MQVTTTQSNDDLKKVRETVRRAGEIFRAGGLVVFPTETVYGIGASAASSKGYDTLRQFKGRVDQPFTLHLPDRESASRYVDTTSPLMQRLVRKLFPGPVTLVVHVTEQVIEQKLAQLRLGEAARQRIYHQNTVGLRCPDHPLAQQILASVDAPIIASSANKRGAAPPQDVDEATAGVDGAAELIVDGGRCRYAKPSTIVRVENTSAGPKYTIERAGVYDERFIRKLMRFTILLVCSGNTCRSPMAEGLATHILAQQRNIPADELDNAGIRVISAGTFASPGMPASPEGVELLARMGIDISRHRSRPLSLEMINEADVIYCMTASHRQAVLDFAPAAAEKTFLLNPAGDIDDPIGSGPAGYEATAAEIRRHLQQRLKEQSP